ncbi:cation-translocating P-type ATPase [Candidatus Methylocalor cossyra]|uniref:Cation-translocating P-type ATPase n=1 Tax=Candidatus Methylocalor cossyra TaxID=3108543 RepID=A0ABM9NL47_9GAMM
MAKPNLLHNRPEAVPGEPATSSLVTVVHRGPPGRARVRVFGLLRNESFRDELEAFLDGVAGVESAHAQVLTGKVLIHFDPAMPLEGLVEKLEGWVRRRQRVHPAGHRPRGAAPPRTLFRSRRPKATQVAAAPPRNDWHLRAAGEVAALLESSPDGLPVEAAAARLAQYGPNALSVAKPRSRFALLLEQFLSPPVALLGVSAGISIATGGLADAAVIAGVVVINAIIGVVTETQAEKTINALGKMTPTHARVLRAGQAVEVAVEEVTVGDVLVLEPGAFVAADARLLASSRLTVDESALTGESLPVGKRHDVLCQEDTPLADRRNMVYMGTVVTGGSGLAMVVATGRHTEIGTIQALVGEVETPDTPMQKQLDRMGMQLALISTGLCAAMFAMGLARGYGWLQMLTSSISLAVAAVPEGLPAVATTTLAIGIGEMRRRRVLVRHLPAVEGLGSVQVICLDKTGTLTMNQMKVTELATPRHHVLVSDGRASCGGRPVVLGELPDLERLLRIVSLCSEVQFAGVPGQRRLQGSATETALVEAALEAGVDVVGLRAALPTVKVVHRAENRPYMITVHREGERHLLAVKGSPAEVLALCRSHQVDGVVEALDERQRAAIGDQNEAMTGKALRVLGVAYGYADSPDALASADLIWLGLAGMEDTLRPGVAELMDQFHAAGIETVMITGDQSGTAFSVGQRLRLSGAKPLEIVDSSSLDKLEPEILKNVVKDTTVFARVSPAHKVKIVQALQASGRVVAMTGDGVNDGPALKAADVGVAMGERGSDVARSVADIVLEDDDIRTMITAVQQGRTIYGNIRKSLRFLLSSNLGEVEVMLIGTALGFGEVLNPVQLLWINLVTDIFPAMALSMEPPEPDVLRQPPRDPQRPILDRADFVTMLRESLLMTAGALGVYAYSVARYGLGPQASTNAFMALTCGQFLHSIGCRSERTTIFDAGRRPSNPYLTGAVLGSFGAQVLAATLPSLRGLLRLTPIGPADLAVIAVGAVLPMLINESIKKVRAGIQGD